MTKALDDFRATRTHCAMPFDRGTLHALEYPLLAIEHPEIAALVGEATEVRLRQEMMELRLVGQWRVEPSIVTAEVHFHQRFGGFENLGHYTLRSRLLDLVSVVAGNSGGRAPYAPAWDDSLGAESDPGNAGHAATGFRFHTTVGPQLAVQLFARRSPRRRSTRDDQSRLVSRGRLADPTVISRTKRQAGTAMDAQFPQRSQWSSLAARSPG